MIGGSQTPATPTDSENERATALLMPLYIGGIQSYSKAPCPSKDFTFMTVIVANSSRKKWMGPTQKGRVWVKFVWGVPECFEDEMSRNYVCLLATIPCAWSLTPKVKINCEDLISTSTKIHIDHVQYNTWLCKILTESYAVKILFMTSGTVPCSSMVGYWSVRFMTITGVLSGPARRVERAMTHCMRLATGESPHSSLKETTAFCVFKKKRKCIGLVYSTYIYITHIHITHGKNSHLLLVFHRPCNLKSGTAYFQQVII